MKHATIKIPADDAVLLKKMQKKFLKKGFDIHPEELAGSAIELASEEENKLLDKIKGKSFNEGNELLKELVAKPFEGGESTNSVKEHNELF